jgi:hypothetical protein
VLFQTSLITVSFAGTDVETILNNQDCVRCVCDVAVGRIIGSAQVDCPSIVLSTSIAFMNTCILVYLNLKFLGDW